MDSEEKTAPPPLKEWLKKRWVQNTGLILLAILGVYVLVWSDVRSRAKEAYQEAEKYMAWHQNADLKIAHFNKKFLSDKDGLDRLVKKGKMSEDEFKRKLDVLQFDKEFHLGESSLKYAYQWYKDTYELFSPPESKWVSIAREKAPETLKLWKEELDSQGIPYEDYMFE